MWSHYVKIAWRNLVKTPMFSIINIAGLSIGLAAGILVLLWVSDEVRYDKFHDNLSEIHLMLENQTQGGQTYTFESQPGPLAAALRNELPEVKYAARGTWQDRYLVKAGEKSTSERSFFVEPDFFKIFHFPAIKGDPITTLADPGSVVITERTAKKLFADDDPIGKLVLVENQYQLKVGAVIATLPFHSSIRFDMALPFRLFEQDNLEWINSQWNSNSVRTWVSLHPETDLAALNAKLENFIQSKNESAGAHAFAYPLEKWRLHNRFREGKPSGGRIAMAWSLGAIGVIILLIACVNFMNLSTARSEKRAREVGVMKVVGAHRAMVIVQFLSEALLVALCALAVGFLLSRLALPSFNRFFDKNLTVASLGWSWAGAVGLMAVLTGLIAGSYPALFLSKFQPIAVLKGSVHTGKGAAWMRKGLVTFQFFISIALILCTIVLHSQVKYVSGRPIGYDPSNVIRIRAQGDLNKSFDPLKADLEALPDVEGVTGSSDDLVQYGSNTTGIQWPGRTEDQDFLVTLSWAHYDWSKTLGIQFLEGRDFSREHPSDSLGVLLNRTAVERMGLKAPVVGTIIQHDTTVHVLGVFEDFVFNDPMKKPAPMMVYFGDNTMAGVIFIKIRNSDNWKETMASVEKAVKKYNPSAPFEYQYVNEEYQLLFEEARSVSSLGNFFGTLAIFISCLGLFGLSTFVAERRRKEISIRKVLGATVQHIWVQLSRDFFQPVILAFVLAIGPSVWLSRHMLRDFDYQVPIAPWMFALAGALAFLIALLTVSFQGIRAALANPVSSLKSE